MFQKNVAEKNKKHNFIFNIFFSQNCAFVRQCGKKHCRTGQATDDNMAHEHCMLDTYGYKHTLRICNTCCFSTATMVARTRLTVTLYVHCLYCL